MSFAGSGMTRTTSPTPCWSHKSISLPICVEQAGSMDSSRARSTSKWKPGGKSASSAGSSSSPRCARVAQLDRASASEAEGCGFDPRRAHHWRGRAKRRMTMTLKRWVLWLCVAALLATEVFLFLAKSQKDAALVQLREARQVAGQLRAQLDQLKNSSVATLSAENARLRAENQNLTQKFSQLQNETANCARRISK
jgi:cell division protein FtsB